MGLIRGAPPTAFIVPDEETWLVTGAADARDGLRPTQDIGRAELLLVPESVPHALVEAVRSAWAVMPADTVLRTYPAPLSGVPGEQMLRPDDHPGSSERPDTGGGHTDHDGGHGEHDGGHDHGDMMEITGEPSADGLVMEQVDVEAGPLGVALPGGLVVSATLDGDVVAHCDVRATLQQGDGRPPDPSGAVAWSVAELTAREALAGTAAGAGERWLRLAAVELERVVNHLAWLHRFCRLLAWPQMSSRVRALLRPAVAAGGQLPVELTAPDLPDGARAALPSALATLAAGAGEICAELSRSRLFARRTAGLGQLSLDDAARRGVAGPVARAAGIPADVRATDPGYRALGFTTLVRREGDARARALLRAEEAARSVRLAVAAIERARAGGREHGEAPEFASLPAAVVEGARGPLRVIRDDSGTLSARAPGAGAARAVAAERAVGREWAAALVTVASFDVSPWQVPE